jgi:ribosomal protein S18 acetylase RimI-like enzyme
MPVNESNPDQRMTGSISLPEKSIRLMTDADLGTAESIMNTAFHSTVNRLEELHLYRAIQPDGWFMIERDGKPAGTIGVTMYERYAYIGMMAIHPDSQHRGLATFAMNHVMAMAGESGVKSIVLDASAKGQPLYTKLGFTGFDETLVYGLPENRGAIKQPEAVRQITAADLDEICRMDAPVFGADRMKVLHCLLDIFPGRGFLIRNPDGAVGGYCFAQGNRIGPMVAVDDQQAEILLRAALSLEYGGLASIAVPGENKMAVNLLEQFGFKHLRTNLHMVKGQSLPPGRRDKVFAQASLAIG